MRVLLITTAYPATCADPRGSFISALAEALAAQGVAVTVLAPGAPEAPNLEIRNGVTVRRATYWLPRWQTLAVGLGGIIPNLRHRPWLLPQVPTMIAALTWHAARLAARYDVIHAHWVYPCGFAGAVAAKRAGKPFVVTSHGGDLNLAVRSRLLASLSRWVTRRARLCIAVSHAMVERFAQIGAPRDRIRFVPLGVALPALPSPGSRRFGSDVERFGSFPGLRVVYAGSLIPRKSVETLLEAVAELQRRDATVALLVIGAGPGEPKLRELIRRRRIDNVCFVGGRPPGEVASLMSRGNVLVLPSISEGRGMVIVEAMALGLPVVASDIPGPRELVVEGETGLLFPVGDAIRLADRLEQLQDAELRARLGESARGFVAAEGLTLEQSARRHVALYRELLAPDAPTARPGTAAPLPATGAPPQ